MKKDKSFSSLQATSQKHKYKMSMGWFTLDWTMVSSNSRSPISLVVIKEGKGHGTAAKTEAACPPSFYAA